jgi:hypothetical protein
LVQRTLRKQSTSPTKLFLQPNIKILGGGRSEGDRLERERELKRERMRERKRREQRTIE